MNCDLGINLMITPLRGAPSNMMHFLTLGVDSFNDGRLYIVDVELPENSIYDGMSLRKSAADAIFDGIIGAMTAS